MARTKLILKYTIYGVLFSILMFPVFFNGGVSLALSPKSQVSATTLSDTSYENIFIKQLNRSFTIEDNGFVSIKDKFQFQNNQSNTLASVDIAYSEGEMGLLMFYEAKDENSAPLGSSFQDDKINGSHILEIRLNQPLLPFSSVTVIVNSVLNGNFSYYEPELSWYGLYCEVLPTTPYEIKEYTTIIHPSSGATEISISPDIGGEVSGDDTGKIFTGSDVKPFETKTRYFLYRNYNIANLHMLNLERTIEINPWGYIRITEEHRLRNYARIEARTLNFEIPSNAKNFTMMDNIGEVTGITQNPTPNAKGRTEVTVNLKTNRVPLQYNATIVYQIQYTLPYKEYISNHLGTKNLRIDLYPTHMDYIIEHQRVKIEIIGASSILRGNIPESLLVKTSSGIAFERINNLVTPYHNQLFDITYKTKFFALFGRAIMFSLVFMIIMGLYVVLRKKRREFEGSEESFIEQSVPIRELTQFVTLIEEKNAIMLDIEKADADLRRKRIQKKVYAKTVKNYQNKLKDLNEELIPFKRVLIQSGGQIQSIIQKLDFLEAEKMSVKDSLKLLADRYKRGKLPSKAAYDRLSNDMMKQLSSSQKKIDRYINELRAYII